MRVLVVGAGGFLGARITATLRGRGHDVVPCGRDAAALDRRFPGTIPIAADLARDARGAWLPRLQGVDAVVNAAGALGGDLEALHGSGPSSLFEACALAGIAHVVQVSALGAVDGQTLFLRTKRVADERLLALRDEGGREGWCVVRPSLVIGRGGYSTGLFSALAAMPLPVRLGSGNWQVQPIHVSDFARAVADLLEAPSVPPVLDLVGPEAMGTDTLTATMRAWLGLPRRRPVGLPAGLLRLGARVGGKLPGSPLTPETLAMLERGNTADPRPATAILGWAPRPLAEALAGEPSVPADFVHARTFAIRPLLRLSLATVWIGTAIVTIFVTPRAVSDALVAGLGLHGAVGFAAIYGGAALDLAIGWAVLAMPRWTAAVCLAQLSVTLGFTALASLALPGAWADPFGPLLKNAAIVGATLALYASKE